ncbi:MAG TPA: poly-gamma-glutamate synthase PgsB [Candidatus Cloacimonas sp.]|jgi:poly-gamma-glutamate synthase PgsB/CapB|nr:poly-gamma-glutamate synthase PgsB [Candidatus Cloacimonas sp.]MDD2249525.1 poly-gamma-glutamate synthase PgsB [Candidatus Cloacimonadota bacterium]MCK9157199.1 poly-gamma-glutamate synthase PgsB [Candidatus Cloacimonas sp.]MCK9164520.1 poly-gamma-glutamate synthase PgsB [Candidatus Cloacimonas sp.]MDD3733377.1 poly-gamma-glutamate synthase PgsB [Candidatus Cloacimonadota bacterium]
MTVLIIVTLILITHWIIEYQRHLKNVRAIPIRIHVNGTRGKSSVTRLIAAGLREGGKTTVAKTTGTLPRVILPDGREAAVIRLMGANIIEQKYIFRHAVKHNPDAIVIECMAVNPVLQWITERKFIRSTISVITNCREDHLDLMGSTVQSVTMCLSNTIPKHGVCYTAEDEQFSLLKKVAEQRRCRIHKIRPMDVTQEELDKFRYIEHAENVQLALAVCAEAGIEREIALHGMQKATPDPGALTKYKIQDGNKTLFFYNVFAANDPQSTVGIIKMVTGHLQNVEKIIILNSRADRLFRSHQLVDAVKDLDFSYLLLTGEIPEKVESYCLQAGIPKEKIIPLGEPLPEVIYKKVIELTNSESHILGIGNIAGDIKYGAQIVAHFKHKMKENIERSRM